MTSALAILLLIIGLAIGALVGWLVAHNRSQRDLSSLRIESAHVSAQQQAAAERVRALESEAKDKDALSRSLIPISTALDQLQGKVDRSERERTTAQERLQQQLANTTNLTRTAAAEVRREAQQLKQALATTHRRGAWGESGLRRLVEVAGMVEYVHFDTQATMNGDAGRQRPDMIVHLAGGRDIAVDAKAPLDALLSEEASDSDEYSETTLARHASALSQHIDALASRAYWKALDEAPEFVVLYLPAESLLSLALRSDPALLDRAFTKQVIVATPTTMLALLRTTSYAWRQESVADNARQIRDSGAELYERLVVLTGHLSRLGRSLESSVNSYNKTVGSFESRVLVSARRLRDMGVSDTDIQEPGQIEVQTRTVDVRDAEGVHELPTSRSITEDRAG